MSSRGQEGLASTEATGASSASSENEPTLLAESILVDNRPNESVYALLSKMVYQVKALNLKESNKLDRLAGYKLRGWTVKKIYSGARQYEGVLFTNAQTRSAVLAHKGTNSLPSLLEDFEGIFCNKTDSVQRESVFDVVKDACNYCKAETYNLSFTGHSLGAFLAELSVYYCHTLGLTTAHAVTFESPGCLEALESLKSNVSLGKIDLDALDIIGYVSYPNLVNTYNHHVGTLCSLKPDVGTPTRFLPIRFNLSHLKSIHTIDNFTSLFSDPTWRSQVHYMLDWPLSDQSSYFFKHATLNDGRYDISEKNFNEQSFSLSYKGHYVESEENTPETSLPLIHFHPDLRKWMKVFYGGLWLAQQGLKAERVSEILMKIGKDKGIEEGILLSLISGRVTKPIEKDFFVQVMNGDSLTPGNFRFDLSSWIYNNPEKAGQLLMSRISPSAQPIGQVTAVLIEGGGELAVGGVIEDAEVLGVYFDIPQGTSPEEFDKLKQLSEHFFKLVVTTGVSVKAIGIAKNAKVLGIIKKMVVAGAKIKLRDAPVSKHSILSQSPSTSSEEVVYSDGGGSKGPSSNP